MVNWPLSKEWSARKVAEGLAGVVGGTADEVQEKLKTLFADAGRLAEEVTDTREMMMLVLKQQNLIIDALTSMIGKAGRKVRR